MVVLMRRGLVVRIVRAARAAGLRTGRQSLINDGFDGARAASALSAATEASVDLLGVAGKVLS